MSFSSLTGPDGEPRIGGQVLIERELYTLVSAVGSGACSKVFRAETSGGESAALKVYNADLRPRPHTRGYKTHYGKARDVSDPIFDEIRAAATQHPFMIQSYGHAHEQGRWLLAMEFVSGVNLLSFLRNNRSDRAALEHACRALGSTLKIWHAAGFAHGDPHLENAIIRDGVSCVTLVDLNVVHHPAFQYCQKFGCSFDHDQTPNRYAEDLHNQLAVGNGFVEGIDDFAAEESLAPEPLRAAFFSGYRP